MTRSMRFIAVFLTGLPTLLAAQGGYRQPPSLLAAILDAPQPPAVFVSPDRNWLLLAERATLPSIAELSEPELRLAGLRINPRTGGQSRAVTGTGLRLRALASGNNAASERRIQTPQGARIGVPPWPQGSRRSALTV